MDLLFSDAFDYPDGLITNEFAYQHPDDPGAHLSQHWTATSGSLFAQGGAGWSGVPDVADQPVDPESEDRNNSARLRAITKRADFFSVTITFTLTNVGLVTTSLGERDIDGVHVFIRRQTEDLKYYVTVNRRDNIVVIKRKDDEGYEQLNSAVAFNVPFGMPQRVRIDSWTVASRGVAFRMFVDDVLIQEALDDSEEAIPVAGAVGIRGDNCEFRIDNFEVREFAGP